MPTFSFVDVGGKLQKVEAPDAATAQRTAPNIKSDSGVASESTPTLDQPTDRINGVSQKEGVPDAPNVNPNTSTGSLLDRYGGSSRLATDLAKTDEVYGMTQKPDENAIRAAENFRAQGIINSINDKYIDEGR